MLLLDAGTLACTDPLCEDAVCWKGLGRPGFAEAAEQTQRLALTAPVRAVNEQSRNTSANKEKDKHFNILGESLAWRLRQSREGD